MHRATRILPFALTAAALAACGSDSNGPTPGFELPRPGAADDRARADRGVGTVRQNAIAPNALRGAYVFAFPTVGTDTLAAIPATRPGSTACRSPPGERRSTDTCGLPTVRTSHVCLSRRSPRRQRDENILMSPTRSSPSWPPRRASRRCQATGSSVSS